ncbi:aspartate aminotransferase family protein [Bradyrhizobium ottawaense]|uniref:aminotransferase class III-fold pyridoxal phosphate-dependent enzyme n=1 Tax=Bradyrhizobium ottawaense TaxID=931866 RepID=UPI000BE9A507|nr:aminotransferase class III-fold pyridoxal phosphate-dependent enzyme [Bradyrhizobium ottawaense]PDT64968.1 aspartate aminotransferase family protein [Bradyrhizobium ottawaense]
MRSPDFQPSGGVGESRDGRHYPLLLERSEGCHVWDTESRCYIDYTMGWGCALLGHRFPPVQEAIRAALDLGSTLPLPHRIEMEVTEALCECIPCAEAVAFGKNGSDACTLAIRLARVATGRQTVLACGYHGWQDWYAEPLGFTGTGVPERDRLLVHRFPFNDRNAFDRIIEEHGANLAAVILEPAGPAGERGMGPGEDADLDFLRHVADRTRRAGALLVFDEIITGFRYPGGSVQQATGVVPDLACFGKALGNGMPLSALVGRSELLREMRHAFYGPTYKGEVLSLAAAGAALHAYRTRPVAEHVRQYGETLRAEINRLCRQLGCPAEAIGPPFRFALVFDGEDRRQTSMLLTLYMQEVLREGMIPYYGYMLPSYAHDERVLARTIELVGGALDRLMRHWKRGALDEAIEIPLIEVK